MTMGTCTEHNYLFSCGISDNHRGICFLKDEKTMRVYDVADKPHYMDVSLPATIIHAGRICGTSSV